MKGGWAWGGGGAGCGAHTFLGFAQPCSGRKEGGWRDGVAPGPASEGSLETTAAWRAREAAAAASRRREQKQGRLQGPRAGPPGSATPLGAPHTLSRHPAGDAKATGLSAALTSVCAPKQPYRVLSQSLASLLAGRHPKARPEKPAD